MSDRNQEPGEAAGPASGEEAAAVRDGRSGDAGRAEAEVNQPREQQAEGVPPREQRGAEGPPVHERAVGTERGAGDTADRVNADDSAGRAGDQDREQRGGAEAAVAGSAETTVPADEAARGARLCSPGRRGTGWAVSGTPCRQPSWTTHAPRWSGPTPSSRRWCRS